MTNFYLAEYVVKGLWGYKDYALRFQNDVNIIIGPNASGKTTLINILYDALTGGVGRLMRTKFDDIIIHLRAFEGKDIETVSVTRSPEALTVKVGKDAFPVPISPFHTISETRDIIRMPPEMVRRRYRVDIEGLQNRLRGLVPAVWLPVSRRLPIADEEEAAHRLLHRRPLESVDECLAGLVERLQQYRLSLNTDLAELRKEFQRHALENILFDKKLDRWIGRSSTLMPPSEEDQQQLLKAFRDVGFVDSRMEQRIHEHFAAARDAITKFKSGKTGVEIDTLLILPLIARTRAMVGFAQELEMKRGKLFEPLRQYEQIVSGFLNDKGVSVSDRGEVVIAPDRAEQGPLEWRQLSSGEKQILILLTQALVSGRTPTVYVADEPELSLHVTWQEKLLASLTRVAERCQFVVATHSPDIAAGFGDKVIDLARL